MDRQKERLRKSLKGYSLDELHDEMLNSMDMGNRVRAECIAELIAERLDDLPRKRITGPMTF